MKCELFGNRLKKINKGSSGYCLVLMALIAFTVAPNKSFGKPNKTSATNSSPSRPSAKTPGKSTGNVVYKYERLTKINLDQSLIDGEIDKPSQVEIKYTPDKGFGNLLKPRKNFLPQLFDDINQIR